MTHHDVIPPNSLSGPATQSCHRILKVMDRLEDRLLRLVDDEAEDPDFVRLSKGVGTLAQLQATYSRRDERNESLGARARETRAAETGLSAVRLTDADRRRMDADAAKLARRERARAVPCNDNTDRNTHPDPDRGTDMETERLEPPPGEPRREVGRAGLRVMPTSRPASIHSKTSEIDDGQEDQRRDGRDHPAGRDPDTPG